MATEVRSGRPLVLGRCRVAFDEAGNLALPGPDLLRLHRDPSPIDVIAQYGCYAGTFSAGQTEWAVAFGPGGLAGLCQA